MSGCDFRTAQLRVLSQTLAHFAHDVQNHLAIINESAGWMKDLLSMHKKQKFGWIKRLSGHDRTKSSDPGPYLSALKDIEEHINRASSLTRDLSGFVHRFEKNSSVFSSNRALEEMREVLLREAGDRGVRLELKLSGESALIEADPSVFQLAVFGSVEKVMETLEKGDCLTIESVTGNSRFQVCLTGRCTRRHNAAQNEEADEQDFYWYIIKDMGGQIQKQFVDGDCVITLLFDLTGGET